MPSSHPVVELRQYTLKSGRRDELIEIFERHFIRRDPCSTSDGGILAATVRPLVPAYVTWPYDEVSSVEKSTSAADEPARLLDEIGATLIVLITERSENNYPRLPIRERENVFVWLARFADDRDVAALDESSEWRRLVDALGARQGPALQTLRLVPAVPSRLA
jgi:hypothetical protein